MKNILSFINNFNFASYANSDVNTRMSQTTSDALLIIVGILLIFFLIGLIILVAYIVILLRRANLITKKVDYLLEDVTYKLEALTPTVDIINKFSNYLIAADFIANRSIKDIMKVIRSNQSSILKVLQHFLSSINDLWDKTVKRKANEAEAREGGEDPINLNDFDEKDFLEKNKAKFEEAKKKYKENVEKKANSKASNKNSNSKNKEDSETK